MRCHNAIRSIRKGGLRGTRTRTWRFIMASRVMTNLYFTRHGPRITMNRRLNFQVRSDAVVLCKTDGQRFTGTAQGEDSEI